MSDKHVKELCKSLVKDFGKHVKAVFSIQNEDLQIIVLLGDKVRGEEVLGKMSGMKAKAEKALDTKIIIKCYSANSYFSKLMESDIKAFNEVREAKSVYDPNNLVALLKSLALSGKTMGTQASSRELFEKVRKRMRKVNNLKLRALSKVYKAVVDSGEAALIARNYSVPSRDNLPKALKQRFVKKKILEKKYIKICKDIINEFRSFEHGSLRRISAAGLDKMRRDAEDFVERMRTIVR